MATEIWVAILALIGTLVGSCGGILVANKLVNFRLEELEKKVEKHNKLVERVIVAEQDIKNAFHEIEETKTEIARINDKITEHCD